MIPPQGFKSEMYPLRHRFKYFFGLSCTTAGMNSCMVTLVKNYKTIVDARTIDVNPHHASFVTETGAVCQPMSIIDKLQLNIKINLTKHGNVTNALDNLRVLIRPIFFSFPEKLDAVDEKSTATVASILEVVKDATEEDVTPLHGGKLPDIATASDLDHPLSTINLAETTAIANLTTDNTMEDVAWDEDTFQTAIKYYTNKGALKACVGKSRSITVSEHRVYTLNINKFVPRPIRRIVPYTFFGLLIHVPRAPDFGQYYWSESKTASKPDLGVKILCRYDEWHPDMNQKMVDA